ncbi:Acid phosphatase [Rhodotorula toruloides]|nr:Acid phosphatase [Rhodotorula toruloides]
MLTSVVLAALAAGAAQALPSPPAPTPLTKLELHKRFVDERFPYKGPAVPVGDWLDQTPQGNGKGYQRLYKDPAVLPAPNVSVLSIKNNINVISTSLLPGGINVHFQTPFGIGASPVVRWGYDQNSLSNNATGNTTTYDRTPPCSMMLATQCSQFFHNVAIPNIKPGSTVYYQIPGGNGTRPSDVLTVKTAPAPGQDGEFETLIVNDFGYTNAHGTHQYMLEHAQNGAAFAWHGGDISCTRASWLWDVCVDGVNTTLPGTAPVPEEYLSPLPAGEPANQGGPLGGDISQVYESNWDLWQQWVSQITKLIPYQCVNEILPLTTRSSSRRVADDCLCRTTPGNHEAACAEFDGSNHELTAMLVHNDTSFNATSPTANLTYYACPPSQRNFTAYNHRFFMNGEATGGRGNHWGSFKWGLATFISFSGETDFYQSPEDSFLDVTKGNASILPNETATFATNSGPFGELYGNYTDNMNYEQVRWIKNELSKVNRTETPWVFAMSHRPMYSSEVSSYQAHMRKAFQQILIDGGIDAYFSGHIHWYERMWPLTVNGTVDSAAIKSNHTYVASKNSLIHLIEGNAGNVESHSTLGKAPLLNTTAVLDQDNYGFGSLRVHNRTTATYTFIKGSDGSAGDYVTIVKPSQDSQGSQGSQNSQG